jgi:hypothetical protein
MTRTLTLALGSLALIGAAAAHRAAPAAEKPTAARPAIEQELRSLEQAWVNAEVPRDAVALRRILSEKFIATLGAGPPVDREAFIAAIVSGTDTDVSQTLSDSTILTDRDTAVIVGTDTVRGAARGVRYARAYRYTATYIKRGGRWVALAEHLVRMPEAK